jgi:ferrochelatase
MDRTGVLLMSLGGAWTLQDVRPFLEELFRDREIMPFPGGPALQGWWARALTALRARAVARRYAAIGGGSPLLYWTRYQALLVEQVLNGYEPGVDEPTRLALESWDARHPGLPDGRLEGRFVAAVAMRYAPPRCRDAVHYLLAQGCRRLVAIPMYPQACRATTGSSLRELERLLAAMPEPPRIHRIEGFHRHPAYVQAVAGTVRQGLEELHRGGWGNVVLLFSAHGLPLRMLAGDPYLEQVKETVSLVLRELGWQGRWELAYQSRVGPVRWTRPTTLETIRRLAGQGVEAVLLVPVSFVSDHLETLYELDVEASAVARRAGLRVLRRAPSLNGNLGLALALADLTRQVLRHPGAGAPVGSRA